MRALAALTVFAHPDIVEAMEGKPMFRVVRSRRDKDKGRGTFKEIGGHCVMVDDNHSPRLAFEIATGIPRCRGISTNHIYAASDDANLYANPSNIVLTPTFLAKLTDTQMANYAQAATANPCLAALRRRAFELYHLLQPDGAEPPRPPGYPSDAEWAKPIGEGTTRAVLERRCDEFLKTRVGADRKDRAAESVRRCGWGWR